MAFDATATRIVGELYEDTQYLKLLAFLCTFRNDTEGCKGLAGVD
jgi:hypothetical protein